MLGFLRKVDPVPARAMFDSAAQATVTCLAVKHLGEKGSEGALALYHLNRKIRESSYAIHSKALQLLQEHNLCRFNGIVPDFTVKSIGNPEIISKVGEANYFPESKEF